MASSACWRCLFVLCVITPSGRQALRPRLMFPASSGFICIQLSAKLDIIFGLRVANISAPAVRWCARQCTRACFSFLVVFTSSPPLFETAAKHRRCILKGEQWENSWNKWRGNFPLGSVRFLEWVTSQVILKAVQNKDKRLICCDIYVVFMVITKVIRNLNCLYVLSV